MTTPHPVAGWYPAEAEHSGEERYWDGQQWTTAYRAAPRQPAATDGDPKATWLGTSLTPAGKASWREGAGDEGRA